MIDYRIFEIPVYRLSEEDWLDDLTRHVERRVEIALRSFPESERERERSRQTALAQRIERPHGWQYNEVIAWIRVKADADVIKGYAWDVQQRRFQRGFTAFPFEGGVTSKVIEMWFDDRGLAVRSASGSVRTSRP